MLSYESRFGAIGRALWAICSWARRMALDAGAMSEGLLSVECEVFMSTAPIGARLDCIVGGKKLVEQGAEAEMDVGQEKGKTVESRSG